MQATATRCQMPEPVEVWNGAAGDIIMDYSKLRSKIIEKYGSQRRFAKDINKSVQTVSRKMTGEVDFSKSDIIEWSSKLDIDTPEIGIYFFTPKV